jgi:hypothetical protein
MPVPLDITNVLLKLVQPIGCDLYYHRLMMSSLAYGTTSLQIQLKYVIIYEFTDFNTLHFYENLITKTAHLETQANNLLKKDGCLGYALVSSQFLFFT